MTDTSLNSTSTHYAYDVNDQRVQQDTRINGGSTTTSKYWSPQYQTTTLGANSTTTMYIYAGGQLLAAIEGNGHSTTTALTHTDHLGSTNVTSSASGTLLTLTNYYPYGDTRQNQQSTTFGTQRGYLGQFTEPTVAMNYLNARWESGAQGRFIAEDPIVRDIGMMGNMAGYILDVNQQAGDYNQTLLLSNPQMLNSYSYSINNPITKSDPTGKCIEDLCIGEAAIATSPMWGPTVIAGLTAAAATLSVATAAILERGGPRWAGPVQIADPSKLLPKMPQPWDTEPPNINPKAPKWIVKVIGTAIAIDGAVQYVQEIKEKVKQVVETFGKKNSSSQATTNNQNTGNNTQTTQKTNTQGTSGGSSQSGNNSKKTP